jgi:basic membrane protein A
MSRLLRLIALGLWSLVWFSACAHTPDCRQAQVFCAALVTDTQGLHDFGISQRAWEGLQRAQRNGTADHIAYIESLDRRDYEKNIAFLAEEGYDVIITAGFEMQDAALHSADLYPAVTFLGLDQAVDFPPPNFIPITFPQDQMGFLAGVIAARLTRSQVVAAVCEASWISSIWRYCEGFRAGVRYADKTIRVIVAYRDHGSRNTLFNDTEWGRATAQDLIQQGADVLFAAGGETAAEALRTAGSAHIAAIGVERDQRVALAGQGSGVVASILGSASVTVEEELRAIQKGEQPSAQVGMVEVIFAAEDVPARLIKEVNEVAAALRNGELKTNVTLEKP